MLSRRSVIFLFQQQHGDLVLFCRFLGLLKCTMMSLFSLYFTCLDAEFFGVFCDLSILGLWQAMQGLNQVFWCVGLQICSCLFVSAGFLLFSISFQCFLGNRVHVKLGSKQGLLKEARGEQYKVGMQMGPELYQDLIYQGDGWVFIFHLVQFIFYQREDYLMAIYRSSHLVLPFNHFEEYIHILGSLGFQFHGRRIPLAIRWLGLSGKFELPAAHHTQRAGDLYCLEAIGLNICHL